MCVHGCLCHRPYPTAGGTASLRITDSVVSGNTAKVSGSQLAMLSAGEALFDRATVEDDAGSSPSARRSAFRLDGSSNATIGAGFTFKCPLGVPVVRAGSLDNPHASSVAIENHPEMLAILATTGMSSSHKNTD